jgi:pre-mRNA-splicing factor CWC22
MQFRRAYKRNDKPVCLATSTFLAHLVNQRVVHEIVALQLLTLLLERCVCAHYSSHLRAG